MLLAENGNDAESRPPAVAAVGLPGLASGAPATSGPTSTAAAAFLGDATTTPPPIVIDIAVPAPKPDTSTQGKAGFKRWAPGTVGVLNPCATELVPAGQTVTVTNLDNGRSAECFVVGSNGVPRGTDIVIQTEVFESLGDVVQAPVPVELRW
jgi:hypothetical protein